MHCLLFLPNKPSVGLYVFKHQALGRDNDSTRSSPSKR